MSSFPVKGTTQAVGVKIGGDGGIDLTAGKEPTIIVTGGEIVASTTIFNFMPSGSFNQAAIHESGSQDFRLKLMLLSPDPIVEVNRLNTLIGNEVPFLFNPGADNVTLPTVTRPLRGFLGALGPFPREGGDVNTGYEVEWTIPISGDVFDLTALPVAPATFAAVEGTPPEVELTWDLDLVTLPGSDNLRVVSFDVFRSETTGGPVGDPYVKVNVAPIPAVIADPLNPGLQNTFTDTTSIAATAYFYVAIANGRFGSVSPFATEATVTTA